MLTGFICIFYNSVAVVRVIISFGYKIFSANGYKQQIEERIKEFFNSDRYILKEVTGDDLNDFYSEIISDNCKGSTAIHYHSLLHKAFKSAVKRRIIPANPCDQADRPRMTQFISSYYNQFEIKKLLDAIEDDPLRIVIVLTAYYGLRRSEVLGIKWEAIDFENKEVRIAHKIVNEKQNGKRVAVGHDSMKTKSSYRTLPLLPPVEEELKIEKERQRKMKLLMKKSVFI